MAAQLALYSDRFFMAAVGVYVLAMFLHPGEYAVRRAAKPAVLATVGAGEGGAPVEEAATEERRRGLAQLPQGLFHRHRYFDDDELLRPVE